MSANIEDKEKHAFEVFKKVTESYYIAINLIINVIIRQTKISTLINSDIKVIVITIDLA
jgi:hypothetical protein